MIFCQINIRQYEFFQILYKPLVLYHFFKLKLCQMLFVWLIRQIYFLSIFPLYGIYIYGPKKYSTGLQFSTLEHFLFFDPKEHFGNKMTWGKIIWNHHSRI